MGLEDLRRRETIDLRERANEIRTELVPELEHRIEEGDGGDHSPEQLETLKTTLEKQADDCVRVADALDCPNECVFVIQELMAPETAVLTDDVSAQSTDIDPERETVDVTPKEGYHRNRTLQLSVVDWPEGMDSTHDRELGREVIDLSHMPDVIADHLYECATTLNDAGSVDGVGNLSAYLGTDS